MLPSGVESWSYQGGASPLTQFSAPGRFAGGAAQSDSRALVFYVILNGAAGGVMNLLRAAMNQRIAELPPHGANPVLRSR